MESKYRIVHTRFWSDGFIATLNALDRYVFLYFLTNEHTNIAGIYELPIRTMEFETGLQEEQLLVILERLKEKIIYYEGWIWIKNFSKYQSSGEKIEKAIENIKAKVPQKVIEYLWGMDKVSIPHHIVKERKVKESKGNKRITLASADASRKKPMYDETYEIEPDESFTPSRKVVRREAIKAGYKGHEVNPLFQWGEEKLEGKKFTNPIVQKTAIKKMLYAGYPPEQIKEAWGALEEDAFWGDKGIDFLVVSSQISKIKKSKKLNPLLYT